MKKLELININKTYEHNIPVLKNVSFSVDSDDFLVLLGPSGSGKSTILSIIAGFEPQNSGDVIIDGINCNKIPCQSRDIAMVFQNYALYPSMNVYNCYLYTSHFDLVSFFQKIHSKSIKYILNLAMYYAILLKY